VRFGHGHGHVTPCGLRGAANLVAQSVERPPALVVVEDLRVRVKLEQPRGCVEVQTLLAPWLN